MATNDPTHVPDPVDNPDSEPAADATDPNVVPGEVVADEPLSDDKTETGSSAELVSRDRAGEPAQSDQPGTDGPVEARPSRRERAPQPELHRQTRIGAAWVAVAVGVVVMVLLLIFILQNLTSVTVKYFGAQGTMPLGVLLLFAAAGGALIVIVLGFARILQMRILARRDRRAVNK